jgi:hypothetical protein
MHAAIFSCDEAERRRVGFRDHLFWIGVPGLDDGEPASIAGRCRLAATAHAVNGSAMNPYPLVVSGFFDERDLDKPTAPPVSARDMTNNMNTRPRSSTGYSRQCVTMGS